MADVVSVYRLTMDIKKPTSHIETPVIVQYDNVRLEVTVLDDGKPFDLTNVTDIEFVHKRPDLEVIVEPGTLEDGKIVYRYVGNEMDIPGNIKTSFSMINGDEKVSVRDFYVVVTQDLKESQYIPGAPKVDRLQELIVSVEQLTERTEAITEEAQTQASYAEEQGGYAKEQGDYAKEQGDYVVSQSSKMEDLETQYAPRLNELTEELAKTVLNVEWFEGDNTTSLQGAINAASVGGGKVKLESDKVYISSQLKPKPNVEIDLNGSTIKLKDSVQVQLFFDFDDINIENKRNFSVVNGTLDGNKENNNLTNSSSGGIYLKNWKDVNIDVSMVNFFREGCYFENCRNSKINLIFTDAGIVSTGPFYAYGISLINCDNIEIPKLLIDNVYGFGVHFRNSSNIDCGNIVISNISYKNQAIGITYTQAKNVTIDNYSCTNSDFTAIECNASTNVFVSNCEIDGTVNSVVFGDNGSNITNKNIVFNNFVTKNTSGTYSLNLNFIDSLKVINFSLDKTITTTFSVASRSIIFEDGSINSNISSLFGYPRFKFRNVALNDYHFVDWGESKKELTIPRFTIPASGGQIVQSLAFLTSDSISRGRIKVLGTFPESPQQLAYTEYLYAYYNGNMYINEVATVIGAFSRKPILSVTGNALTITNNTSNNIVCLMSFE